MSTRTQEIHAMLQAHLDELVNQSQRIEDEIRLVQASLHALMGQAVVYPGESEATVADAPTVITTQEEADDVFGAGNAPRIAFRRAPVKRSVKSNNRKRGAK